jgi:hypothetical protein
VIEARPFFLLLSDGNSFGGQLNEKCGAKFENQAHRLLKARADVQPNPDHNLLLSGGEYPCGSPRSFGGLLTGINSTNVISIYPSRQNTELFHICKLSEPKEIII